MKTDSSNEAHERGDQSAAVENPMKSEMERLAQEWDAAVQRKRNGRAVDLDSADRDFLDRIIL